MPDISMCHAHQCPKAPDCYRFRAVPGYYQTFADFYKAGEDCGHFWPLETRGALRSVEQATKAAIRIFHNGEPS